MIPWSFPYCLWICWRYLLYQPAQDMHKALVNDMKIMMEVNAWSWKLTFNLFKDMFGMKGGGGRGEENRGEGFMACLDGGGVDGSRVELAKNKLILC